LALNYLLTWIFLYGTAHAIPINLSFCSTTSNPAPDDNTSIAGAVYLAGSCKEQPFVFLDFLCYHSRHGKNEQSLIYNRLKHLICNPVNVKQNRSVKPCWKLFIHAK